MIDYDAEFDKKMRELRCLDCRAKLAEEYIHRGRLAIICWRCKKLNRFVFKDYRDSVNAKIKTGDQSPNNTKKE